MSVFAFSPLVLALGIFALLFFLAIFILEGLIRYFIKYVSPPIKWSLWHLSRPLRIAWLALRRVVPLFRYTARARVKRHLMEKSDPASPDLEQGRLHASSSGSIFCLAKSLKSRLDLFNRRLASNSPTLQLRRLGDPQPSTESLSEVSLVARRCGHDQNWHCRICGTQACFRCSVELSESPPSTRIFSASHDVPAATSTPCAESCPPRNQNLALTGRIDVTSGRHHGFAGHARKIGIEVRSYEDSRSKRGTNSFIWRDTI